MMAEVNQREVTRLCAKTAQLLLENGAESALVINMTTRLGQALGVTHVECGITANSVVLTTIVNEACLTTARQVRGLGVNMMVVVNIQQTVFALESGCIGLAEVNSCLENEAIFSHYPGWLVALMTALSCAAFARLAEADWVSCGVVFLAALSGMVVRLWLQRNDFNGFVVFIATGFVATLVAGLAFRYGWVNSGQQAMASSVLMLVPGFPLINALSDVLKGYMNLGVARWTMATVLTLATCIGIMFALLVVGISPLLLL